MRSRSILNFVLFLVVLVLTLNLYLVKDSTTKSKNILTDIQPGEISRISIQHNKRLITLGKDKGVWSMVEPINIPANNFRVGSILKLLKTTSHGQYITDGIDLKKYGLDQPATSIKFDDIEINFGITNPVSNYRYIKINEKIYLIDDIFYPLLSSQIGTLVSRTLLPEKYEIKKLILPENILELDKDDTWTSAQNVSADAIVETISSWKNDQAFGVHNYIKRKSLGNIEVHLKNQDVPIKFKITDTDPWLVIARPELNIEYHFNTEFYNRLIKPGSKNEPDKNIDENNQQKTLVVPAEEFLNTIKQ